MDPEFVAECRRAFNRLVHTFGFDEPEVESLGHETFVRYHRNEETVSISRELGATPIIELFYPSIDTGERPIPWAERHGVPRSRRIPALNAPTGDRGSLGDYLDRCAARLESLEGDFLRPSP